MPVRYTTLNLWWRHGLHLLLLFMIETFNCVLRTWNLFFLFSENSLCKNRHEKIQYQSTSKTRRLDLFKIGHCTQFFDPSLHEYWRWGSQSHIIHKSCAIEVAITQNRPVCILGRPHTVKHLLWYVLGIEPNLVSKENHHTYFDIFNCGWYV